MFFTPKISVIHNKWNSVHHPAPSFHFKLWGNHPSFLFVCFLMIADDPNPQLWRLKNKLFLSWLICHIENRSFLSTSGCVFLSQHLSFTLCSTLSITTSSHCLSHCVWLWLIDWLYLSNDDQKENRDYKNLKNCYFKDSHQWHISSLSLFQLFMLL